jgi:tetratricopeptide (TPR) repeat protein
LDLAIDYYGQAAAVANNGEFYYKQGMLAFELEDYDLVIKSLTRALASNNLSKRPNAVMTMAQAYFYSERYRLAYRTMKKAAASNNARVVKNAQLWLKHIKATALANKIAYQ